MPAEMQVETLPTTMFDYFNKMEVQAYINKERKITRRVLINHQYWQPIHDLKQ